MRLGVGVRHKRPSGKMTPTRDGLWLGANCSEQVLLPEATLELSPVSDGSKSGMRDGIFPANCGTQRRMSMCV